MSRIKKIGAAVTSLALCAGMLSGCSETRYIISYGDKNVNSGVYIYSMMTEMQNQILMMQYSQGVSDNFFDQKVEGKDFAEYISEHSKEKIKEYAAIVDQFEKLDLSLSDEELKQVNDSVNESWKTSSGLYEDIGVSKESMKLLQKESLMYSKIFDYFYDEGGKEEVKHDELVKYLEDNYVRYKTISIAKSTNEDESEKKKEDKESKATIDKYLKKAGKVSFDDFDSIIEEYQKETQAAEEAQADDESGDLTEADTSESSAAEDTSSQAESDVSSETEASSAEESSPSEDDSSQIQDDTASSAESLEEFDTESTSDESGTDADSEEEEDDEYANEQMVNYGTMSDEDKESTSGKLAAHVKEMKKENKAESYEDDEYYYIVIKGSVADRAESYIEENKDSLLNDIKGDEFKEKITKWEDELGIKENTKAFKKYTPKEIYDKWQEYEKNNQNG